MYKQTRICVRPLSQSLSYSVTESVSHTNMANAAPVIFLSLFKQTTVDETTKKQTSSLLLRTTSHTHTKLPAVLPAKTAPVILLSSLTQTLHMPSSFASSCSWSRISNLIVCFLNLYLHNVHCHRKNYFIFFTKYLHMHPQKLYNWTESAEISY
jgi:hypothetical protein